MRKNFIPMYEVGMNIVTEGEKTTPIYEVWKGIVTEGEKTTPIYEVWKGIVTEGYVRKNFIPMYEV